MEISAWRDESWSDCERWPVMVLTWRAAEDCSRYEGRRPEKLGHRQLTAAYGGQSVTMPRRNADDIELRCLLAVCVSAWQPKTPRLTVMEQSATRDSGLLLTFTFRRETKSHLFASHTAELALSTLMVSRRLRWTVQHFRCRFCKEPPQLCDGSTIILTFVVIVVLQICFLLGGYVDWNKSRKTSQCEAHRSRLRSCFR